MSNMPGSVRRPRWLTLAAAGMALWPAGRAAAWDENGHGIVTVLAVGGLPPRVPAWVRAPETVERLNYLASEPDRWRGIRHDVLTHWNNPDHYFDVEFLDPYGLTLQTLPPLRYDFVGRLAVARSREPARFADQMAGDDPALVKLTPGMLPYRVMELYEQLLSGWTTLRTLEQNSAAAGPHRIAAARERIFQTMGLMSHYVGDAAQPLHTTKHFNGWVGDNPRGYTVDKKFHQFIDGGVIDLHELTAAGMMARALPARGIDRAQVWPEILAHIERSHAKMEPLYALEKSGDLRRAPGKAFIEERLLDGGAMLGGLWTTAHDAAGTDDYLQKWLASPNRMASDKAAAALPAPPK